MSDFTQLPHQINPPGQPQQLHIEIDGTPLQLSPIDFTSPDTHSMLRDRITAAQTVIISGWELVVALPEEVIRSLLALASTTGPVVQVRSGLNLYPNPFLATLALPLSCHDLTQVGQRTRCAILAAAVFHQQAASAAAGQIKRWCADHAVPCDPINTITREIRAAAEESSTPARPTAQQLADIVLAQMQAERELSGHELLTPPLRFWRGDFYHCIEQRWMLFTDPKPRIVRILQQELESASVSLTDSVISSTLTNIQAKTLFRVPKGPVYVHAEEPLQTTDERALVLANGILPFDDLIRCGHLPPLRPHDPRLFAPILLPHAYDPTAGFPQWQQTLAEVLPRSTPDDRRQELLQEFVGYSLMPWDHSQETFLTLFGGGANGKSTVLNVIRHLLGEDNVSAVPLDGFGSEFRIGDLADKLANIASDMPRMEKVQEGLLKQLASGEPTQLNRKHRDPVTLYPTAKLFFGTNALPPISDTSDGMWRRMQIIPFQQRFDGASCDRLRAQRLKAEMTGILNWALLGALRLLQQGRFTHCAVCEQHRETYRVESDPFLQFVGEWCAIGPDLREETTAMYAAYRQFCEEIGRRFNGDNVFGRRVHALFGECKSRGTIHGRRCWLYNGFALTPEVAARISRRPIRAERTQP